MAAPGQVQARTTVRNDEGATTEEENQTKHPIDYTTSKD